MKKRLFITIITFILSYTIQSQITKGNWMVGGSGSYTHMSVDSNNGTGYKNSRLTIKPNIGYFIKDKFAVGSSLSYYQYKSLTGFNSYTKNYGIGVFSRYYFLKIEKIINIFSQVHFDKDFYENNAGSVNKGNGYRYGLKVGQVIFFNSSVGLEFSVGYEKIITGQDSFEDINIGIGFQVHLEKK